MSAPSTSPVSGASGVPDGLADDLGWLLLRAARGYLTAATGLTADVPGGVRGHHLMRTVTHGCPATQLELAGALGLDRTVLTYLVDDLAAAGLVERQSDPADRRARRVVITDAGRTRLAEVDERLAALEANLLPDLPGDQRGSVLAALRTLATATGAEPGADC